VHPDLVKELVVLGLTLNQAKIYLTIVQAVSITVSAISESTKVHRQDIYKILPKLEKMGLIAKTIDTPFKVKAIPIEAALNRLVINERKKENERINRLETTVRKLVRAVREQQKKQEPTEEDIQFILLSTDAGIKNMADSSFESARIGCDMILSSELIAQRIYRFRDHFQTLSKNKCKTRLIIETPNNEELAERVIEEIRPHNGNFEAKLIHKDKPIPYHIIDRREVWINREKATDTDLPCVLWTNSRNIAQFREETFEKAWNSPGAIIIYPKTEREKRKSAKARKATAANLPCV